MIVELSRGDIEVDGRRSIERPGDENALGFEHEVPMNSFPIVFEDDVTRHERARNG
jgi:hypothetical protein